MSIELEHSFDVPIPPEQAWDVLLDVKRVAPCMPGATVDEVSGDEVTGRIKVKVGPIGLTYAGKARFTERDPDAHAVTIEASGKETRGAGTAVATVRANLEPQDGQTRVIMRTSLNVTGRPAQFGRGVMSEVAGRLVEQFSANLAKQLAAPEDGPRSGAASDSRLALPIAELSLPTRSYNSLKSEGIQTVGDLVARTGGELLTIKGLGEKSVGEIEGRLGELGLSLKDTERAPEVDDTAKCEEPEADALDLFDVAAGPVLKRALPVAAALIVAIWLGIRLRRLGRRG
jgi:uncharacterized protein